MGGQNKGGGWTVFDERRGEVVFVLVFAVEVVTGEMKWNEREDSKRGGKLTRLSERTSFNSFEQYIYLAS